MFRWVPADVPDSQRPVHEPPESPDGGQARRVAAGALTQQIAQVTGLVVLLAVVTVLARRLSLSELGTYGLTATLATYLLIVKNSIGGAAQRAMVAARGPEEQSAAFSTAAGLYALTGLVTGLLIAGVGAGLAAAILDGDLREQAQLGVLGLGAVSAVGLAATVNLDAMRAALLLTRSAANEIAALVVFAALMLTLALSDAPAVGADRRQRLDPAAVGEREPGRAAPPGPALPAPAPAASSASGPGRLRPRRAGCC